MRGRYRKTAGLSLVSRSEQIGRDPMEAVSAKLVFGKTDNSRAGTGAADRSARLVLNQRQVRRRFHLLFFFHARHAYGHVHESSPNAESVTAYVMKRIEDGTKRTT
jgi:hypothetical protein